MFSNLEGRMDEAELSEHYSRQTRPLLIGIFNLIVQFIVFMYFCIVAIQTLPNIEREFLDDTKYFFKICITLSLLMMTLATILLMGILQTWSKWVLVYVWVGFIRIIMFFPICIALITMAYTTTESKGNIMWTFARFIFYSVIDGYVVVNMYRYYREIRIRKFERVIRKSASVPYESLQ